MDRLVSFVEEINARLCKIEYERLVREPEFTMLVEQAITESTKPISSKRLAWLASLSMPDPGAQEHELQFRRKSTDILSRLSDEDVAYLISFHHPLARRDFEREIQVTGRGRVSVADAKNLPDQELFEKRLAQEQINIHKQSLSELDLIELDKEDTNPRYNMSNKGRLFLYVIGEEQREYVYNA